jgi:cytochrome c biogenesis protein CcdA/thiol-disulfide isomerase/thioredoxin
MVVSFVGFTFLLLVVLNQFVELADTIRIATFQILFLFGIGFLTSSRSLRALGGVLGGLFFLSKGWIFVLAAAVVGLVVMELSGRIASRLQQTGLDVQQKTRTSLGADSPLSAFIIGMTLGLVWVPCAGPALGFALTLVREQPGFMAALALTSYALGTALPLLIVGYGGQAAVHSVRALTKYTGIVKIVSGVLLVATAIALQLNFFQNIQIWILEHTMYGDIGTRIEKALFSPSPEGNSLSSSSPTTMTLPMLPKITRAPEFSGLGPWHNLLAGSQNSEPFTLAALKGKVVLVDFWTYSCINCIRTLPYIQGYWDKYGSTKLANGESAFVLLGVHSPEFTFEKSEKNVAMAIKQHGLTYPIAQDNNFGTWSAFANHYWPAKYLIDANGYIRYTHFGEGNYEETDRAIAALLQEAGVDVSSFSGSSSSESKAIIRGSLTSETYMGVRSWPALGNAQGEPTDVAVTYSASSAPVLHKYYLDGSWQLKNGQEYQELQSVSGRILGKFQAGEINLVLGLAEGAVPVQATVTIDGKETKTFTIDRHDLYELFKGSNGTHEIVLSFKGKGVQAFAFTFGG